MKILKWVGVVLGSLIVVLIIAYLVIVMVSNSRLNQTYDIQVETLEIPTDSAAIAKGMHIAKTRGCFDCHGDKLEGKVFMDNPAMGRLISPNLTLGRGGVASYYNTEDWIKSIRHGINSEGKPLLIMPSEDYFYMSDEDLKNLLAYVKSIPAVDNELPENSFGPVSRMLLATGELKVTPDKINHDEQRPQMPAREVSVEYGKYLSYNCIGCHGRNYSGGKIAGADPSWPPAANLTPDKETGLGKWKEEDFFKVLRTGIRIDGRELHPSMPRVFQDFTDDEIKALWLFFQSLPASKIGEI